MKYDLTIPRFIFIAGFLIFVIGAILVFFIPEPWIARASFIVAITGVLLTLILSGKGKIKIVLGKKRMEKLAAEVYRSEEADDSQIFSVIEMFRTPKVYFDAFSKSNAKNIKIIGSATPMNIPFLGAIYRLTIARKIKEPKMEIYHVDYPQIDAKFTLSEKDNEPQHVVLWGSVGKMSKYGIDICWFSKKAFHIFKREFDRLEGKAKQMEEHVQETIIDCYSNKVTDDIKTTFHFVEKVLVHLKDEDNLQKHFDEKVLKDIEKYVKEIIRTQASDRGARLGITKAP